MTAINIVLIRWSSLRTTKPRGREKKIEGRLRDKNARVGVPSLHCRWSSLDFLQLIAYSTAVTVLLREIPWSSSRFQSNIQVSLVYVLVCSWQQTCLIDGHVIELISNLLPSAKCSLNTTFHSQFKISTLESAEKVANFKSSSAEKSSERSRFSAWSFVDIKRRSNDYRRSIHVSSP